MGGIVGKLSFDARVAISAATVQRMLGVACDAAAPGRNWVSYAGEGIALGSSALHPGRANEVAHNETSTVHAVADSELLNAASLRRSLAGLGHVVNGASDAELMVHAYEEWGDRCVERFSGPFALAIWDERERRLLLARDHVGIRPLCFAVLHGDGVVFGSDIRALLQDPSVGREWHPAAVDAYLALGYVPAPLTLYRRVSKLEAAHTLVVEGRRLTTRQYWDFSIGGSYATSEREALDLLESCLRSSLAAHAAEPNAVVLASGGVASATLAALLPAGRASMHIAAGASPADLVHLLVTHLDEPYADPSAVVECALFAAAREHVDIAVTGHGAAILWAGAPPLDLFADGDRHDVYTRRFAWQVRDDGAEARRDDLDDRHPSADAFTRMLYRDARTALPDNHLAIAHRAAALAGLRLRHPFLDRELVDLAFMLPAHLKVRGTTGMYALRQIAARYEQQAARPPAHAHGAPAWLAAAVAALVPHVLLSHRLDTRGIFSRPALASLWDEHRSGRRDHAHRLWSVLMLELWLREFIDGDAAAEPLHDGVFVRAA